MRDRRIVALAAFGLLAVMVVRHPSADVRVQLHDPRDLAPHRVQAALDLGIIAVSILVTWTAHRFA